MGFFISEFEKFRNKNLLHFFSRNPKPEINFVLDIGTESIKALILEKKEEKIFVLGSSLEYYDQFSVFFRQFEKEVVQRTISKAIADLEREIGIKSKSVILGLPPNIFVSRVISQPYKRKEKGLIGKKEKEEILKEVLEKGKKKISRIYASEKGILPEDLQFLNLKILETKIDGYPVPDILNYEGKNLDFHLLVSFLPKQVFISEFFKFRNKEYYLSGEISPISLIKELGFEISGLVHIAEGLISLLVQNPEGIFLDVGGEVTQIFLSKDGIFEQISEFNKGGKDFSQVLSERLGLDEPSARDLKHRYAKRDLSEESRRRIRQFFEEISQNWFNNLKEKLKEMSSGIFPSEFFIFGGGALLPEIEEMLVQGDWEGISFAFPPKVKFITSKDLINVEDATKSLNNPQNAPSLLLGYTSYYHNYGKKVF